VTIPMPLKMGMVSMGSRRNSRLTRSLGVSVDMGFSFPVMSALKIHSYLKKQEKLSISLPRSLQPAAAAWSCKNEKFFTPA
jgi:hypothetical protein